jgi:peptidyl-prolyl cis-trans isomerase A (cyclophilin A)
MQRKTWTGCIVTMALVATLLGPAARADEPQASSVYYLMSTSLGDVLLELNLEKAPTTVGNFADYAAAGFYDGTIFHRVIADFMIQCGGYTPTMDRKTAGLGPPIANEWKNGLKNVRGALAMARAGGDPDSATSQFFIDVVNATHLDQPQRDGAGYAVFGKVIAGMATIDKIRDTEVKDDPKLGMGKVVPVTPVIIKSIKPVLGSEVKAVAAAIEGGQPLPAMSGEGRDAQVAAVLETIRAAAKHAAEAADREALEYAAKVEQETGKKFQKTASGLMYMVLQEGTGDRTPAPTDQVEVHYTGWFLDGNKFDSSVDRGTPATFPLNGVIRGWTEGVGLMKVGEKCKFIIPWKLAYGARGKPPTIPPRATLVFDVELLNIK